MAYYGYNRHQLSHRDRVSLRYGGLDEDIRRIFFQLSADDRRSLFCQYENEFGRSKRQYAERTYKKWRNGEVRMSGGVSERLLDFLPPLLPAKTKYDLIETLWTRLQNRETITIRVRPDTGYQKALDLVAATVQEKLKTTIPDAVRSRLSWLSGNDAYAAEQLIKMVLVNRGDIMQREAAIQIRDLFNRFERDNDLGISGSKQIVIGGTTIVITMRPTPFYRRMFAMEKNNSNPQSRALVTHKSTSVPAIQNPNNLLEESIKHLSPEQQSDLMDRAANEALRLQVKEAESRIDISISQAKMDQATDTARDLNKDPMCRYRIETEHEGTRLAVQQGCLAQVLLLIVSPLSLMALGLWL